MSLYVEVKDVREIRPNKWNADVYVRYSLSEQFFSEVELGVSIDPKRYLPIVFRDAVLPRNRRLTYMFPNGWQEQVFEELRKHESLQHVNLSKKDA